MSEIFVAYVVYRYLLENAGEPVPAFGDVVLPGTNIVHLKVEVVPYVWTEAEARADALADADPQGGDADGDYVYDPDQG